MFQSHRNRWAIPLLALLVTLAMPMLSAQASAAQAQPYARPAFNLSGAMWYAAIAVYCPVYNNCSHPVPEWSKQPNFQCAEYVARALAAGGAMSGLDGYHDTQGRMGSYVPSSGAPSYNLLNTYGLKGYLDWTGQQHWSQYWHNLGATPYAGVQSGDVVFMNGYSHVVIGSGMWIIDSHNAAAKDVPWNWFGSISSVYRFY